MTSTRPKLDALSIVLPRGTRVTLRAAIARPEGGAFVPAGTAAVTVQSNGRRYLVETLSGDILDVSRDQILPKSDAVLRRLGREQDAFRRYRSRVDLAAVVGSRAWNLATPSSDTDVRGAFTWTFEDAASLFAAPDEIHHAGGDESYWEVEKLIRQALRADPNTLETLWSPDIREASTIGHRLVDEREIFTSRLVIGAFGRYAQGQAKKLEAAVARERALNALLDGIADGRVSSRETATAFLRTSFDGAAPELENLLRSLRDKGVLEVAEFAELQTVMELHGEHGLRPTPVRPKNAYNLIRLLHSCLHWIAFAAPMITTSGLVRDELMSIKRGEREMSDVVERARELGREIEDATHGSTLPEVPNHEAADAILRAARTEAARSFFRANEIGPLPDSGPTEPEGAPSAAARPLGRAVCAEPLPSDVDSVATEKFFRAYEREGERTLPLVWVALTGAHAYGFPSPDSDLDLKAIHAVSAENAIGRLPTLAPVETIEMFEGREFDFSSHDIAQSVGLLEKGNGNLLERLLGPFVVVRTPLGEELAHLAAQSVSQRSYRHYRGFFGGSVREYKREDPAGTRSVKRLLYAYRVALTGTHLLTTGEIETDVRPLAERYGFANVARWIERKTEAEGARLSRDECQGVEEDLIALTEALDGALQTSPLPPAPPNMRALDEMVVRARRASDLWELGR